MRLPGDEKGPCPCGHRHAMCHRANAARYCPTTPIDPADAEAIRRLWDAANHVVAFHAPERKTDREVDKPHLELRNAVMTMVERADLLRAVQR